MMKTLSDLLSSYYLVLADAHTCKYKQIKFSLNCRIVLLYMLRGSSAYSYAVCPSSRKCSSKWRLRLLDFQSNYSQQRDTVHFLRHWLYSLSPRCMSAVRFKADTEAAEAQRPYGADGQSHSPLNPADLCLSLCLPLLTHILYSDA